MPIEKIVNKVEKQAQTQATLEKARRVREAFDLERKRRRREESRRRAVEWTGGIITFVGINGSFFILLHKLGIFTLLTDRWGLGSTLSAWIIVVLWIGFAFLLALTFFWISDKTGLHYLIEDWIVSWDTWDVQQSDNIRRYRSFPRRARSRLIRELKKELREITDQLYRLECEADETEDEKLSDSVEGLNRVIGTLNTEADISSRSLIRQPEYASWKSFVLALEETSNQLNLELKNIGKYHKDTQPLLRHAFNISSQVLSWIVEYSDEKKEGATIGICQWK
jgi:hypothetical protein